MTIAFGGQTHRTVPYKASPHKMVKEVVAQGVYIYLMEKEEMFRAGIESNRIYPVLGSEIPAGFFGIYNFKF